MSPLSRRWTLALAILTGIVAVGCTSGKRTSTVPRYTSEAVIDLDMPPPALAIYIEVCRHHIVEHWRPPAPVEGSAASPVVVGIRIDREGRILETQVVESSCREPFESSALAAVQALDTLPPPPDDEVWELAKQGIFVKFREN